MRRIHQILSAVVAFGVLLSAGAGEAADLKYRVRKRLCSDTFCPLENELMASIYPPFIDVTGQLAGDEVISNAVDMKFFDGSVRVWVDGDSSARIRVNGGAWHTIVDAREGESIELKLVASAIPGRMVGATAHVGTRSEAWHVTTAGGIPVTFSAPFAEKTDQDMGVNVTSNEVVVTFSGETLTATISGGQDACVIVNWVGGCLASQQVASGDTLQLRVKTPSTPGTREMSRLTVGASYADWYVKTAGEAVVDYSGSFTNLSGQLENDLVVSNAITVIGGFEGSVSATVSGDGSPELSVNGGAWATTASVVRNDSVRMRMTTAGTQNTSSTSRLTAGGVETAWTVETGSPTVSFSGDFTDLADQDKNIQVDTTDLTVAGISGTLLASASGEGNPQISTDGGITWGTTANVGDGATILLRMTTASTDGTALTAKISVGSSFRDWKVTTKNAGGAQVTNWNGVVKSEIDRVIAAGVSGPPTVTTIGGSISGSYLYLGAILAPNGKIYAIPQYATNVLVVDPATDTVSTIGYVPGGDKYVGGILAPNGNIYGFQHDATGVLKINPVTGVVSAVGNAPGQNKWYGGALAPNGKVYVPPYSTTNLEIFDPATDTITTKNVGTNSQCGAALAPNGKIYSPPAGSGKIMIVDPQTETVSYINAPGSGWCSSVVGPDGKIYSIPTSASSILVIDPATDTVSTFGSLGGGSYKWFGAVLAPNGKIYGVPMYSNQVLEVDPVTRTTRLFGTNLANHATGALAPNGKIYCMPMGGGATGNQVLVIDVHSNSMWTGGVELSAFFSKQP